MRVIIISSIVFYLLLANSAGAQVTPKASDDEPIKVETVFVYLPVIVNDRKGRSIAGLKKEDFWIEKAGEKQTVEVFETAEAPITLAILVDTSGSALHILDEIKGAVLKFVETIGPKDRLAIMTFDADTRVRNGFVSDKETLRDSVESLSISPNPGSNMTDAVYRLLTEDLARVKGRKAIVVLSDLFVSGKISKSKLFDALRGSDTLIYPIYFDLTRKNSLKGSSGDFIKRIRAEGIDLFNNLATASGGLAESADKIRFGQAFQNIADDLRKQYLLGFYPTVKNDSDAVVKVNRKDAVVRIKRYVK